MVDLADNALTTWDAAKEELGLLDSSLKNSVTRWINALSAAIENYCGRSFYYEAARVDYVSGFGRRLIRLPKAPIVSLSSIYLDDEEVDITATGDVSIHDAGAGLLMKQNGWAWTTYEAQEYIARRPIPGQERKAYKVTYACGYITPKQVAESVGTCSLPYDIEYACLRWLASARAWKGRDPAIKSERLTTWSASYFAPSAGVSLSDPPPEVAQLLASHRWEA